MAEYIILFLSVMLSTFITYKVSYKRGYERGDHNGFTRGLWKGYDAEKRRLERVETTRKKPRKSTEDFAWLD
jgi:hypothetical protein